MHLTDYLVILNITISIFLHLKYRIDPRETDPPTAPLRRPPVSLLKPFAKVPKKKKPLAHDDEAAWKKENGLA